MMTDIKRTTKKGEAIVWDYENAFCGCDIYDAYDRPSMFKVASFNAIRNRANNTPGYNHDLKVVGAGSHFYSTVYSYNENGTRYIVKDTRDNTYRVALA